MGCDLFIGENYMEFASNIVDLMAGIERIFVMFYK